MLFDTIEIAKEYGIDKYITTNFMLKSLSQNYALINYMLDNDIPLVVNNKLNSIFSYMPGAIKKKYGIDLKELQIMYPMDVVDNKGKGK